MIDTGLNGKNVIVTGANHGIGAAIAATYLLRRIGEPEDIAKAVIFLASVQADWITGQVLYVGGGNRM
jgi:NAD(P)-dependent dehydrogenase (short-subunit alcohol dehydrogenase family)